MLTRFKSARRLNPAGSIAFTIVITSLLLASGCGVEFAPASTAENKVVWEGNIDDRPEEKAVFEKTASCITERFGIQKQKPHPRLVLISDQFMVEGQGPYDGYIFFEPNIMYVRSSNRELWIISHEAIHWMYQIGDSLHGSEPFIVCQQ